MKSNITNKISTERYPINVMDIIKKMTRLSFDAEEIYGSKDWPHLWQKANLPLAMTKAFSKDEELAKRKGRNRRFVKIFLWGIASLSMYLVLFINQGIVTEYFTRGGFFTLAIVVTAIAFALVHGSFAGHILEDLNNKAVNRDRGEH